MFLSPAFVDTKHSTVMIRVCCLQNLCIRHAFKTIFNVARTDFIFISGVRSERNHGIVEANRIIGGNTANIEDFPYQLSLEISGAQICGAAILSDIWVITAAHCVARCRVLQCKEGASQERNAAMSFLGLIMNNPIFGLIKSRSGPDLILRAGTSLRGDGGSTHHPQMVITHRGYSPVTQDNDIALIKVDPPFNLSTTVQPAHLPVSGREPPQGSSATVTGWGVTREGSRSGSKFLQQAKLYILPRNECLKTYPQFTRTMLCAGDRTGGHDSCQGDSGGPLTVNGTLVGLVSFGRGCGRPGIPGVYSNVAALRNWIGKNTGL
ncbi:trypsin delta-like isoform X1 [Schistocerca gregaria]|uniref:trypsin delta-like isoform X1 n=1 Tax=Schistocerca gregaria TaxID=7010 RepID=UPI00211F0115|nr:trypsin delta-like isoform X1 [Schistocerca gregaria]